MTDEGRNAPRIVIIGAGMGGILAGIELQEAGYDDYVIYEKSNREKLRPSYRAGCKRLIVSTDFYQAIQRPNARLVTAPIERARCAWMGTSASSTGSTSHAIRFSSRATIHR